MSILRSQPSRLLELGILGACLFATPPARAQIQDQILVYAQDKNFNLFVHRYDRGFNLLGSTPMNGVASSWIVQNPTLVAGDGSYTLALDALNLARVVRLDPMANVTSIKGITFNAVAAAIDKNGTVYVLTRIPLSTPGPMTAVDPANTILWSNWSATSTFTEYPDAIAISTDGDIQIGATAPPCDPCFGTGKIMRIDPTSGNAVGTVFTQNSMPQSFGIGYMFGTPHGGIWAWGGGCGCFHEVQQETILNTFPVDGGYTGKTYQSFADSKDNLWAPGINDVPYNSRSVLQYSAIDGALLDVIDLDAVILSMSLGPTGEELLLTTNNTTTPQQRSLRRINLVTKAQSFVPVYPEFRDVFIPYGDPTGWNWAAVVHRDGDNDGDGRTNGVETDAGSNPYDPLSRPNGPKAYVWFLPNTNAIALRFIDPDGLLHPAGGLDLNELRLFADGYGDILPALWPFVTSVQVSPDGTDATVEFGLLPLPNDLAIKLEVRAVDKKGFHGSDWQITPPGMAE